MSEAKVHNYAFRKALGYVRNKRGRLGIESIKQTFESTTHQKLSTQYPYMPSYYPIKSFVILLQIIKSNLGERQVSNSEVSKSRCCDIGFYLYAGPEESDSPYHYLDPHKDLPKVMGDFYHNLKSPSAIFKGCDTNLEISDSEIVATWKKLSDYIELFYYLEGVHLGMIKESSSEGKLTAIMEGDSFVYTIKLLE
jgi:hypothetical protein